MNNCYNCINHIKTPGNSHIRCLKPDMEMTGDRHGIKNGWFYYPLLFDPVWATKKCSNFESSSGAVSV